MGIIIAFVAGITVSSVVWFFVWRNNKKLLENAVNKVNGYVNKTGL